MKEWLTLIEALSLGFARADLTSFYHLARNLVVKRESEFDLYDRAFAYHFKGIETHFDIDDDLLNWLSNPVLPRELSEEDLAKLKSLDLDELRKQFEERMREQNERHDGGNRWVGTGGTSPFGHGGHHPSGVRVGGPGGGRTAIQVAEDRKFQNLRTDRILDTRDIGVALRRLRKLAKDEQHLELDLPASIDKTAREAGEIDLVFSPPRHNRTKLLLLMDVGGSMDPFAELSERLFSAAHAASHFKAFKAFMFHNCVYEHLYTDIHAHKGIFTEDLLKEIDNTWTLIFVGDASMSPYELSHQGGAIYYGHQNATPGIQWLRRLRQRVPNSVWLNPEPKKFWGGTTSIGIIHDVFPMYEFTLSGITEAIDHLRGLLGTHYQPPLH